MITLQVNKWFLWLLGITFVCLAGLAFFNPQTENKLMTGFRKNMKCSDFNSKKEAQAAFNNDPFGFAQLDRDNDRLACESLN